MSYAHINGAQLHYDTYGADPPDRPPVPILLIHGAMSTGQSDWQEIVRLLARRYRVVVPDCRGHGFSTNPERTYRFGEMADDLSELIRRLGYTRAHVVGHSNGGNIALVMLLEHSDAVQSCTLQAANAFVSPDLSERLLRWEAAALTGPPTPWTRRQGALHGPMHGRDYWRELLSWTVTESISAPRYTAADLQLAARPVLVIQGARDAVNASGGHGVFLAGHIPEALCWFPEDAGHDVHADIPCQWVERVLGFVDRHGDDANAALDRLRRSAYAGSANTVFDVRAAYIAPPVVPPVNGSYRHPGLRPMAPGNGMDGGLLEEEAAEPEGFRMNWCVQLRGSVLTQDQRGAAVAVVRELAQVAGQAAAVAVDDQIQVLLGSSTLWALLDRPLTDLLAGPDTRSERVSQVLAGERLRILREEDGWAFVQMDGDGYLGWLPSTTLRTFDADELAAHSAQPQALVTSPAAQAYARPSRNSRVLGRLPFGATLSLVHLEPGWAHLRMPGGAEWWVPAADVAAPVGSSGPQREGVKQALRVLQRWVGVPYLPGGRTAFGVDAPGLAQVFLRCLGLPAPRAAEEQFRAGQPVAGRPLPGDLVFFAHELSDGDGLGRSGASRVSHVAISRGGWQLLQAGGGALDVNVLNIGRPRTPAARWLRSHLAGVRRVTFPGGDGPEGHMAVAEDGKEAPCT